MNKKGFTLIEILGVIVIIGLLLLIVAPNLLNRINPKEEEISNLQEEMIKEAAILYLDATHDSTNCIEIQTLVDHGYLNDDIKGVIENNDIKNQGLSVTRNSNNTYTIGNLNSCTP